MREGRQYVVQWYFYCCRTCFPDTVVLFAGGRQKVQFAAEKNVILKVTQYPTRGQIYDRNGKLIVINAPVYDIMMIPKESKNS